MRRQVAKVCALASVLACCGDPVAAPSAAVTGSEDQEMVAGPDDFYFIVDGPLVTNGPPWDCVTAGTDCGATGAAFFGTLELVADCLLVRGSESAPGFRSMVIFPYGVTWDEATQTIHGLGPKPLAIGDRPDISLSNGSQLVDDWTSQLGLPEVPDKARECMQLAGTAYVSYNTPWIQVGEAPLPADPSGTTAPTQPA